MKTISVSVVEVHGQLHPLLSPLTEVQKRLLHLWDLPPDLDEKVACGFSRPPAFASEPSGSSGEKPKGADGAACEREAILMTPSRAEVNAINATNGNGLRILVVEDYADTAETLAQLLRLSGH